jgi:hypothetical protein
MENVMYEIVPMTECNEEVDIAELVAEVNERHAKAQNGPAPRMRSDRSVALEVEYSSNYTVKGLGQILDYYNVSKRKLRKDEMVQILIFFEEDPENAAMTERRRRLWKNVSELKADPYFSKFIIFDT